MGILLKERKNHLEQEFSVGVNWGRTIFSIHPVLLIKGSSNVT